MHGLLGHRGAWEDYQAPYRRVPKFVMENILKQTRQGKSACRPTSVAERRLQRHVKEMKVQLRPTRPGLRNRAQVPRSRRGTAGRTWPDDFVERESPAQAPASITKLKVTLRRAHPPPHHRSAAVLLYGR